MDFLFFFFQVKCTHDCKWNERKFYISSTNGNAYAVKCYSNTIIHWFAHTHKLTLTIKMIKLTKFPISRLGRQNKKKTEQIEITFYSLDHGWWIILLLWMFWWCYCCFEALTSVLHIAYYTKKKKKIRQTAIGKTPHIQTIQWKSAPALAINSMYFTTHTFTRHSLIHAME